MKPVLTVELYRENVHTYERRPIRDVLAVVAVGTCMFLWLLILVHIVRLAMR